MVQSKEIQISKKFLIWFLTLHARKVNTFKNFFIYKLPVWFTFPNIDRYNQGIFTSREEDMRGVRKGSKLVTSLAVLCQPYCVVVTTYTVLKSHSYLAISRTRNNVAVPSQRKIFTLKIIQRVIKQLRNWVNIKR